MGFWPAFFMCLAAGLATGVGSFVSLIGKGNKKFLACALGFSAGIMIYVSFVEILQKARQNLIAQFDVLKGNTLVVLYFFCGVGFVLLVDLIFSISQKLQKKSQKKPAYTLEPDVLNNSLQNLPQNPQQDKKISTKLWKTGFLTAIAMALHNFPEGLATFISAYYEPSFAITVAVAIAMHNIPEGIAVSFPIYYATGNKKKAFFISFLSGFAEPAGALIGYFVLLRFFSPVLYGILFAAVAGMMVYLCVKELLPSAGECNQKYANIGFIVGMLVIAVSLILFLL